MAKSSLVGVDRAPAIPKGRNIDAKGPSDSSDSGSDIQGDELDLEAFSELASSGPEDEDEQDEDDD
jgi:hypothetical protein